MRFSSAGGRLSGMHRARHEPAARDAGVARLRRATRFVVFGATALAGAFAGLAAHSAPGQKSRSVAVRTTTRTVRTTTQAPTTTEEPATTPTTTYVAPATTATPPPVTTTVAPVATTGGT
jgi:serine/threonine-protein kinase